MDHTVRNELTPLFSKWSKNLNLEIKKPKWLIIHSEVEHTVKNIFLQIEPFIVLYFTRKYNVIFSTAKVHV